MIAGSLLLACNGPADTASGTGTEGGDPGDTVADSAPYPSDTAPPPDPWCSEPADAPGFDEVGEAWNLVDTTDEEPDHQEAGAVALVDLDGDGLDDLALAHRTRGILVQMNLGGSFGEEVIVDTAQRMSGLAVGDVDGDRDLDLWAGGYTTPMRLYLNDGEGGLTSVGEASGLAEVPIVPLKTDAVFGDYDGDGDLDLFVNVGGSGDDLDEARLDKLLENDGSGVFTEVSAWLPDRGGVGWSSVWTDIERDGDGDLYTANADQSRNQGSRLLRNDGPGGDGWLFTDLSGSCACSENGNPMGVSAGDYDGDGLFDLFLTNTGNNQLLWNQGDGSFVDVSVAVGGLALESADHMSFGGTWFDHGNDGTLDVFFSSGPLDGGEGTEELAAQADQLLLWEDGQLVDRAPEHGMDDRSDGRGVAEGMLDDDGFLDLVLSNIGSTSKLYVARCTTARALVVELVGAGANTWGVGAVVSVETDDGSFFREVTAKPGWGGARTPRAHVGLGERRVEAVTVTWPDGQVQQIEVHPVVDGRIVVEQPG